TGKMAVPSENVMNTNLDDPVTKAVVDNIMGNLPTKKPLVRCEDCDLSFTSQAVLDTHLQGARHAKQVRSKNIMATLEETKISFTKDEETNGLKCNVCNVCLNSIQQLQTHLNGSRHKKKLMRGEWDGKESQGPPLKSPTGTKLSVARKNDYLKCDICNKFFNSGSQYSVHMNSEKHADKVRRSFKDPNKSKAFVPYWRRPKHPRNTTPKQQIPSLSLSFVSGNFTYPQ
ncbi:ZN346 protein, partial [Pseudoatta argentina]